MPEREEMSLGELWDGGRGGDESWLQMGSSQQEMLEQLERE